MPAQRHASRERILHLLKTRGPLTTRALADELGITATGMRQHLRRLADAGLIAHRDQKAGVGRPARRWSLTASGEERFPDGHADLTLFLLKSIRQVFGVKGLDKLAAARGREQAALYREQIDGRLGIEQRLAALAEQRSAEGYMAEWKKEGEGVWLLVESHCPVAAAARLCGSLCQAELDAFRSALGEDVEVERSEHLLCGARRCAYRIAKRARPGGRDGG